ncbi:recombinase family protein [Acidiphilium angustum]|uniref:recombinase family protein n=1 Tax=Acidiphilium angustum TaxID=523 RepID=UPI0004947BEA|nr:recombinase family protein [Acidiphilium angustum]
MARTFLYTRVSTIGQTTENQISEVKAAGFSVQSNRTITETISGSCGATNRVRKTVNQREKKLTAM